MSPAFLGGRVPIKQTGGGLILLQVSFDAKKISTHPSPLAPHLKNHLQFYITEGYAKIIKITCRWFDNEDCD